MFVLKLYVPGRTRTKQWIKCVAQGNNTVTLVGLKLQKMLQPFGVQLSMKKVLVPSVPISYLFTQ